MLVAWQPCFYYCCASLLYVSHSGVLMLQYLHSISESKPMIIHRDLKLENIMLSPEHHGKFRDRGVLWQADCVMMAGLSSKSPAQKGLQMTV